ncbi:UNVERIFIED_CONTAM: hypothetical protein Slati_3057000 [Sesamum latifolium]|uniref:Uncharacterized protein n=1 Tax=Sesamum latifolium TaxID=2727402 RepID=A0AAW2UYV3_9LAMI
MGAAVKREVWIDRGRGAGCRWLFDFMRLRGWGSIVGLGVIGKLEGAKRVAAKWPQWWDRKQ